MINKELIQQFKERIPIFDEKIHAFEKGEIDRNTFKGISGGFGSYAQKEGGYMLRLRLPGGRISKDTLKFIADSIKEHRINLLKLTTCQTIQLHNLTADNTVSLVGEALDFGIITLGGGGDNPRNTMCSPLSGIEKDEAFDVLPYAEVLGEYLVSRMPSLHMPRKLKVGFSNSPANETHVTFRDLGFAARKDGTFSVYCAGGLGPNPKLGVHILDGAKPEEVTLYASAMIRLFTEHGNYTSRAKARTRYLQDTLGVDGLRTQFLSYLEEARNAEKPWPITPGAPVCKRAEGTLDKALLTNTRVISQKQDGLYAVSYHPLGGRLSPEKTAELYEIIKDMEEIEIRLAPNGTMYIINLNANEVSRVLEATQDGAASLFETSISCIGTPICQHGLRNSFSLLSACIERVRQENFADRVLPQIRVSGCPSSCGTHQSGTIGFVGHTKKVDGKMMSAFKMYVNGRSEEDAKLGTEVAVILETVIPDFLVALGQEISRAGCVFEDWYPEHVEEFNQLAAEYADKTTS